MFGAGDAGPEGPRGPKFHPANRSVQQDNRIDATVVWRRSAKARSSKCYRGVEVVVASTDVHQMALYLMRRRSNRPAPNVTDIGVNRDPEDIVKVAIETDAEALS